MGHESIQTCLIPVVILKVYVFPVQSVMNIAHSYKDNDNVNDFEGIRNISHIIEFSVNVVKFFLQVYKVHH